VGAEGEDDQRSAIGSSGTAMAGGRHGGKEERTTGGRGAAQAAAAERRRRWLGTRRIRPRQVPAEGEQREVTTLSLVWI